MSSGIQTNITDNNDFSGYRRIVEELYIRHHLDLVSGRQSYFVELLGYVYFIGILGKNYCEITIGNDYSNSNEDIIKQYKVPLPDKRISDLFSQKLWKKSYQKNPPWPTGGYFVLYDNSGKMVVEYDDRTFVYNHFKLFASRPKHHGRSLLIELFLDYLKQEGFNGDTLVYAGDAVFRKSGGVVKVEGIAAPGGRIVGAAEVGETGSGQRALCYITDHLGSTRLIIDGSSGNVLERSTYTPMGRRWTATGSGSPSAGPTLATNRYRYNGKEEQELAAGLPYTDYGARFFDPDHCTWLSPDPLSGKYPGVYPYAFCAGDPVNYVDPDGRDAYVFDSNGYFVQKIEQKGKHYISVREI